MNHWQFFLKNVVVVCDALRDLVPFVQLKNREKHPWRTATLIKVILLQGCLTRFLSCANGTTSRKKSHFNLFFSTFPYDSPPFDYSHLDSLTLFSRDQKKKLERNWLRGKALGKECLKSSKAFSSDLSAYR